MELSQHEADAARQQQGCEQESRLQHFLTALKQKDTDINALTRTGKDREYLRKMMSVIVCGMVK